MATASLNFDSTIFFYTREKEELTEEGVDAQVDAFAHLGLDEMFFNVNAQRTSYRSDVWPALWDGYDPNQGDEQPFFKDVLPKRLAHDRKGVANAHYLAEIGLDPYVRWMARCRHHGISPAPSIRMHDLHYAHLYEHRAHHDLHRRNEYRRVQYRGFHVGGEHGLDFAQPEVYDFHWALIKEVIDRYDADGLELDWSRHFCFLRPGHEMADLDVLNRMVRDTRAYLDKKGERSGRRLKLTCRVPERLQTAEWIGLDVLTWLDKGWVDQYVPTSRFYTTNLDMPVREWQRLVAGSAQLSPGLERAVMPYRGAEAFETVSTANVGLASVDTVRGCAATFLSQGADGIYFFNYFDRDMPANGSCLFDECADLVRQVKSLDGVANRPRRHVVTYQDYVAPGEKYAAPLPLTIDAEYKDEQKLGQLRIHIGPRPQALKAFFVTSFEGLECVPDGTAVYVNGVSCTHEPGYEVPSPAPRAAQAFAIPLEALHDGYNLVEIACAEAQQANWADISFVA